MSRAFAAPYHSAAHHAGFDAAPAIGRALRVLGRAVAFSAFSLLAVSAVIGVRVIAYWH